MQPDEHVQRAMRNIPRFVTHGADPNDVQRTLARISRREDWTREWSATAAMHEQLANEAEERGHTLSAGEAYLRAGVCYHWAKFRFPDDQARYDETHRKSVATYWKGLKYVDPTAERLDIPLENITMAAHLRYPQGKIRPPVVVILAGTDSVKEECFHLENVFLKRGMATLSLDGPGQGETRRQAPAQADYEKPVSAIIDCLEKRENVDGATIGVFGFSRLGGYYAVRSACLEHRIKACVAVSGPYGRTQFPRGPGDAWFQFITWTKTRDETAATLAQFSLEGILANIRCPLLLVHGKQDEMLPYADGEQVKQVLQDVEAAGGAVEFVLFEEGSHACNNIPYKYQPLVGDWMADHLLAG